MKQATLAGDVKEETTPVKMEVSPLNNTVEEGNVTRITPGKFNSDDIPDEEGYNIIEIDLFIESTLQGKELWVSIAENSILPLDIMGSCWGYGGSFDPQDLESIEEFFSSKLKSKRKERLVPYLDIAGSELEYEKIKEIQHCMRFIPVKNYFVNVPDELLEMLEDQGFDFESWMKEYNSVEENYASKEDIQTAFKINDLVERGKVLEEQIKGLNDIKEMVADIEETNKIARSYEIEGVFDKLDTYEIQKELQSKLKALKKYSEEIRQESMKINTCWGRYKNYFDFTLRRYSQTKLL